ncbi:Sodium/hydrogen exchanger 8 like protein [Argiope bruennichi]|uniref:Sodium/hydrogen exchanger n=1 Tax=Argiope bruennichi TaxID=94029 RepID=A0A8T0F2R5_ARGBR|nr:Sodium/hydrogen exchanger 8 like protein [Argiope bruennichi]
MKILIKLKLSNSSAVFLSKFLFTFLLILNSSHGLAETQSKILQTDDATKNSLAEIFGNSSTVSNSTHVVTANETSVTNDTSVVTTSTTPSLDVVLPQKGSAEEEHHSSMAIFFYLPESVSVVFLGALIGLILKLISNSNLGNWQKEEAFNPTTFFLVLLPPIMYESGYNLHKGNFFQNIGSILVFAIFGTAISAFVIGGGVYLLGVADVAYKLDFTESFAFGSLVSAVDPVATIAIFHALDVEPVLNMLVFGESILNDAVSIVLATTVIEAASPGMAGMSAGQAVLHGFGRFFLMFFASAAIGVVFALTAALLFKYVDLRKNPSLEFAMILVFTYAPYGLAEGLHLSGIMSILFNGIVMSHYTHFNLSPVTQITMQQTLRTLAFFAETCVFAYLGLAIFSFRLIIKPSLVIWSIVLCLLGRALKHYIFELWLGAISYALALHLEFEDEKRHVIVTTTLIIVLFTTLVLGGSTMPLMKFLKAGKKPRRKRKGQNTEISLSKTKEMGKTIDAEHLSELTEEEYEVNFMKSNLKGFVKLDVKYLIPFFTRRFTHQEVKDCKSQMTDLTNQWYQAIRGPSETDSSDEEVDM